MWTFLLTNLLNPFAAIAKRIYAVFADNPAARMMLFAGILVASLVFGVNQCRQRANYENKLATANVKNDSLTTQNYALLSERNSAIDYAEQLTKSHETKLDSIRADVRAMPAADRHKLNRKLLTELGLIR